MSSLQENINSVVISIRTKNERSAVLGFIQNMEARLFQISRNDLCQAIQNTIPYQAGTVLGDIAGTVPATAESYKNFFLLLERTLSMLKVFKIEIAGEPSEHIITHIISWVRRELGEGIILDIDIDKSILGGARLMFQGRYKEYTLAKSIENFFERNQELIVRNISQ